MVWSGSTLYPFSVWSDSTLFATLSSLIRICTICHSSLAVLLRPKLFAFVSSLIRFYTFSWKSHQCLHCLPFSAVWSGSTLFAILTLIRVYTICLLRQSDRGLHFFPFSAVSSGSTLFPFLSGLIRVYTFSILSLIRVYIISRSQQSDQDLHYLPFFLSSIIKSSLTFKCMTEHLFADFSYSIALDT